MRRRIKTSMIVAVLAMAAGSLIPASAEAQTRSSITNRQKTKNDWRNVAYAGAGLGVYGLLKGDPMFTFVGAAGALYAADRYEHDRKSQAKMERSRAAMFRRGYFYRNGHKYVKRTTKRNGHKYYYFVRT
ncbi:MAG: hypothetical protein HYR64_01500 [Fimbriimonas ginsengisoli]|uniref:YtxH domain-containing protein n=1 Tax=Fimbriimonas ginsengisoli TaxID=1005039 RepID=A0A931LTY3_FIMGI|nr:hypothetical protein [Fimbriimonas ginsengisoli]